MLQRLGNRYDESQKAWMAAEAHRGFARRQLRRGGEPGEQRLELRAERQDARLPGHDYERVMLLTYMALNPPRGDYDSARVAIRQTHEFEAQVAELRAKQYAQVEEKARKRGARTSVRELNGYPVETIDNPAVNALRNSYQSALSLPCRIRLRGAGRAEPRGARLPPGERAAARPAAAGGRLRGLDERLGATERAGRRHDDVLIIIGSGTAPAIQSRQFALPMWGAGPLRRAAAVRSPVITTTSAPASPRRSWWRAPCRSSRSPASTRWRAAG